MGLGSLPLAGCTVITGALADNFSADRRLAAETGLTFTVVDQQVLGEIAWIAVSVVKILKRCAATADGALQDILNGCAKRFVSYRGDSAGSTRRVDARHKQCLGSVDIADADHDFSVHDEIFHGSLAASREGPQQLSGEFVR